MGLSGLIKETASKVKAKFEEKAHNHLSLNVCMLGARGVGKTSVLCAILDDAKSMNGFVRTRIKFMAKDDTRNRLSKLRHELIRVFDNRTDIAAIPATKGESTYEFELGMIDKAPNIDLSVVDYPGESLVDNPDYVSEKIKTSDAVIIAIDSPYIMEEEGKFNEEKNRVSLITKFIRDNLESFKDKLVMFVPLKCEKYLDMLTPEEKRRNRAEELSDLIINKYYKESIDLLKSTEKTAVLITPILTAGGVKFDRFEEDEEHLHIAKYKFYDGVTSEGDKAKYRPIFCAQPLFHLLSFVTQCFVRHRNSATGVNVLLQSISDFFKKNEDFFLEMKAIDQHRINSGNGYRVICGKHLFFTKNN